MVEADTTYTVDAEAAVKVAELVISNIDPGQMWLPGQAMQRPGYIRSCPS